MFVRKSKYLELLKKYEEQAKEVESLKKEVTSYNKKVEILNNKAETLVKEKSNLESELMQVKSIKKAASIDMEKKSEIKNNYKSINELTEKLKEFHGKKLSPRLVERIIIYLDVLEKCQENYYLNSVKMGEITNLSASIIRKDMSVIGVQGVRGKGYEARGLANELRSFIEMKGPIVKSSVDTCLKRNSFKEILKKGLEEGFILRKLIVDIDYSEEQEISDYYEAIEELEDRGIRIE